LHIIVKDNQIVSYSQSYVDDLNPVRERQNTISSKAAVDSLYTYSELRLSYQLFYRLSFGDQMLDFLELKKHLIKRKLRIWVNVL
ncbi:MAG: two-component system regulatory protein YycI, partial [Enterococcus sp.]|nr:two-component system regulatory protein YycI [Enterococcus sp.]